MPSGLNTRDLVSSDGYVHFYPMYHQSADPGAVGASAQWTDTSLGAGNWVSKRRSAANDAWETVGGKDPFVVASGDGAIAITAASQTVIITKGTAAALTLANPTATTHDGATITFLSTTAAAHTVSNAAGAGFNNGGAASDIATFGAAIGNGFSVIAYQGKWYVDPRGMTNVTLA